MCVNCILYVYVMVLFFMRAAEWWSWRGAIWVMDGRWKWVWPRQRGETEAEIQTVRRAGTCRQTDKLKYRNRRHTQADRNIERQAKKERRREGQTQRVRQGQTDKEQERYGQRERKIERAIKKPTDRKDRHQRCIQAERGRQRRQTYRHFTNTQTDSDSQTHGQTHKDR